MTPGTEAALVVDAAVKRCGSVAALDGVSFELGQGELVGLLGPNGAGKTTAIRAIAGRVALDSGRIALFGRALTPGDRRPELGVVPQELAIYPLLTARENLEVFGALYGVTRSALAARVKWALDWCGLADRAGEPTKRFSGGMKRRLNIACSLLHQPAVVLLDEPTVGVDPQSRERIYEMLLDLRSSGVSILLTTHHLEEAEQRCERIVIIDRGRIAAAGTVGSLVRQTLGGARTLRLTLAAPLAPDAPLPAAVRADATRRVLTTEVTDVGHELPALVSRAVELGGAVVDVDLAGATLQDVFIALTGRELRE
jgi:ABC-2 type transport system ATP-binding protein